MKERVSFRALADNDMRHVREWLADWLVEHVRGWSGAYGLDWTPDQIKAHVETQGLVSREWDEIRAAADDPERFVCMAMVDDALVGMAFVEQRTDRYLAVPMGVLSWIYVHQEYRRKGVARQLIAAAHQWLLARNLTVSEVFVTIDNGNALNIYQRAGYQQLDCRLIASLVDHGGSS